MSRLRAGVLALLVLAATATCIRLGLWQLSRLHEKRVLHAAQRAELALPPIDVSVALPAEPPAVGRRVRVRGRWDRSVHVLLSGRSHLGAAGVSLVTPVRLPSGEALLVERGWLPAADSRIAHPERLRDDTADLIGVATREPHAPHAPPWVRLESESAGVSLWSARALEADSAASRVRGPLAPWLLRALPIEATPRGIASAGAPRTPAGARATELPPGESAPTPEPYVVPDEAMHLSYAIQWFAFAGIVGIGSLSLAWSRARRARRGRTA